MKSSKIFFYLILAVILGIGLFTYTFSNLWLLATDQTNYIPKESNIFFFHPTKIDEGSGGYWRYGEDLKNYYYFSEIEENTYFILDKKSQCRNLDKTDYLTWCRPLKATK
ncbi:hypothetical protein AWW72_10855 [Acinetobacter sp. NRRL B-65365]|uniref:hypothetical protein n=1 Tax=Acinetobacter sp. NRRL B-65365 TaxID=1785092 RepID=UPI0007A0B129|nr:hypothetical protein [Acinetobacter sp. NRRL B-65365]KYQ84065.1 hypothetical protein AWW72_10855 [Acinetobacter sp. NRRL B-65365]